MTEWQRNLYALWAAPLVGGLLSAVIGIRPIFLVAAAALAIPALGTRGLATQESLGEAGQERDQA